MRSALTILFFIMLILSGCSPAPRYRTVRDLPQSLPVSTKTPSTVGQSPSTIPGAEAPIEKPPIGTKYRGVASYYADKYHGNATANGEIFDMNGLSAAHRTLPFNTWLEVRNLANDRTVIVRVNDRGPYIEGRILDLSYGAAREIDMIGAGIQEVEITVLR